MSISKAIANIPILQSYEETTLSEEYSSEVIFN